MSTENTAAPTTEGTHSNSKPVSRQKAVTQNGVARPMSGHTAKIWEIADRISAETKAPAKRAAVISEAEAAGVHPSTAATQFGKWCRFHGLKLSELKASANAATEEPKKAKKAKKGAEAPVVEGQGSEASAPTAEAPVQG